MFVLQLNPMTSNAEHVVPVMCSETAEALKEFLKSQRVEPYVDDRWRKEFRKDSPLEWFNAPNALGEVWVNVPAIVDVGTREDWMRRAGEQFDALRNRIPSV